MEELRQQIINLCNNSKLPLEAVYFILKDIWRDAEATLRTLQEQAQQKEQKEENEE